MAETIGGIVLAGGRSSRMGRNKALLRLEPHGPTLIEKVVTALGMVAAETLLVTNTPQDYAWLNLPMVGDNVSQAGPLAGIEAGLRASRYAYNLVVGCDMPYLQPALLNCLLSYIKPHTLVVMPRNAEGEPEPLCAVYSRRALPAIQERLQQGHYKITNLEQALKIDYVPAHLLQAFDPALRSFVNLNTPADLIL